MASVALKVISVIPMLCLAFGYIMAPKHLSWLAFSHILFSIIAFGFLALAALQASLLYIQNRALKTQRGSVYPQLLALFPPLQTMERLLFQMMTLGFVWLSASLLSAFLYIEDLVHFAHPQKIVLSALTWVLFALILYRHYCFGFRGLKAIQWTFIGLALLTSTFLAGRLTGLKF